MVLVPTIPANRKMRSSGERIVRDSTESQPGCSSPGCINGTKFQTCDCNGSFSFKKNGTICKKCNGFGVLKTTCQQCDHVLDWLLALPDNGLHLESNLAKHDTQCGTAKWPAHGESGDTGGGGISSSSKSSNGSEQKSQGKRKARSDPSGGSSGDNSPSVRDPESKESNADRSDGKGFACIYHKRWPREYPRDTQKHWFISVLLRHLRTNHRFYVCKQCFHRYQTVEDLRLHESSNLDPCRKCSQGRCKMWVHPTSPEHICRTLFLTQEEKYDVLYSLLAGESEANLTSSGSEHVHSLPPSDVHGLSVSSTNCGLAGQGNRALLNLNQSTAEPEEYGNASPKLAADDATLDDLFGAPLELDYQSSMPPDIHESGNSTLDGDRLADLLPFLDGPMELITEAIQPNGIDELNFLRHRVEEQDKQIKDLQEQNANQGELIRYLRRDLEKRDAVGESSCTPPPDSVSSIGNSIRWHSKFSSVASSNAGGSYTFATSNSSQVRPQSVLLGAASHKWPGMPPPHFGAGEILPASAAGSVDTAKLVNT